MPDRPLARLQVLLRDLFQFDYADLDFGIYRLLRLKRDEVEAFLTEQLPRRVDEVFKGAAGEVHAQREQELAELAERVRQEIDADALAPTGEIKADYLQQKAKAARELIAAYEAKRKEVQEIQVSEEQKAEVFNHLWAFFSRYYEAGDFIPKRRYGARETYAVPYNGEEVFFHWANRDQHYVKTAEALRDYAFTVDMLGKPCRVRFTLTEASLPPGNTKGDTRYFFPLSKETTWDNDTRTFTLSLHYRLSTETEVEKHGKNSKLQESVLQAALPKIIEAVPDVGLKARLAEIVEQKEDEEISLLLKRLRHFCRKNTSDYFIHKNLDGFLRRELEFYLKDQVLHLADLDGDLPAKQRTLRVVRQLAEEVIQFLAQIENVQKRLFEKRKFVLKTDYLVPIQNVPRALWKEVAGNDEQLAAWKELFSVEPKKVSEKFLADHPTLVVNTAHFDAAFKTRLLTGFGDLDEATDGLLIHAENYQVLRFLERKFAGGIECIYIDPPYNAAETEILYKNQYKHSSWLALMAERLASARKLLSVDGSLCVTIDDYELHRLKFLLDETFGPENALASVVIRNNPSGRATVSGFAINHEYGLFYSKSDAAAVGRLPHTEAQRNRYDQTDEQGRKFEWENFRKSSRGSNRNDRPKQFFPIFYNEKTRIARIPNLEWQEASRSWKVLEKPTANEVATLPIDGFGTEKVWNFGLERTRREIAKMLVEKSGEKYEVYKRKPLHEEGSLPRTWWDNPLYSARDNGTRALKDILGPTNTFDFPKAVRAVEDSIRISCKSSDATVFDFFSGSGTSGHAVINLNRVDDGGRRFILVEIGEYFDTVLQPRIQKVMFTPEWRDGKPVRMATEEEAERTPRLVKVLRLEGYEDALHNLVSEETLEREMPRAKAFKQKLGGDAYRLTYMTRLPLEASASMLNLAKLEHPFAYTIEVLGEDGPRTETVDLVETFNFLYGLHVQRIETWREDAGGRDYRAVKAKVRNGRRVLVLWRDTDKLDPAVEREFLEARLKKIGPFDEAWINGDCAVPGVQSLDGLFKRLLEEEQ
jgi:adenine-specific DNA-methyltransferase